MTKQGRNILPCFAMLLSKEEEIMAGDVVNKLRIELNNQKIRTSVSICKGDTISRTICITLLNSGTVYDIPTNAIATLMAVKPDGKTVYNDCTIQGNEIQYNVTNQLITMEGDVECQIKLTMEGNVVLDSPVFVLRVYGKLFDESILESTNDFSALQSYCIRAETAAEKTENVIRDTRESVKAVATECNDIRELVEQTILAKEESGSLIKIPSKSNICMITNVKGLTIQSGIPSLNNPVDFISIGERNKIDIRLSPSKDFSTILETYSVKPTGAGLRSIGKYCDELCFLNHEMYIKRRIKSLTLTGQIEWNEISSGNNEVHIYSYPVDDAIKNPDGIWFISNRFLSDISKNESQIIDIAIQSYPGRLVFTTELEEQSFSELWEDNDLEILYVLEEPEITEVLDGNGIIRYTSQSDLYAEAYDQDLNDPISITMQIPQSSFGNAVMELL